MDVENMTLDQILEELNDLKDQGVKAAEAERKEQKKTANADLAANIDRYDELGKLYLKKHEEEHDKSMDAKALKERADAAAAKHMEKRSGNKAKADGVRKNMDQLRKEARIREEEELQERKRAVARKKKMRDYTTNARNAARKRGGGYAAPLRF